MTTDGCLLNGSETIVKGWFEGKGWEVFKPAWPDLLMINPTTKEVMFVEVKYIGDRLSAKQISCFNKMQQAGLNVKVSIVGLGGDVLTTNYDEPKLVETLSECYGRYKKQIERERVSCFNKMQRRTTQRERRKRRGLSPTPEDIRADRQRGFGGFSWAELEAFKKRQAERGQPPGKIAERLAEQEGLDEFQKSLKEPNPHFDELFGLDEKK